MIKDLVFQVLDKLSRPLLVIDANLQPIYCNYSFFKLVQCSDENDSINIKRLFPELNSGLLQEANFSLDLHTVNGKVSLVEVQSDLLGDNCYLLSLSQTVLSSSTLHTRRLETLGMLAGSVAHDFNNILAGILGHVSFLKSNINEDKYCESLSAIEEGSQHAAQMTREILRYSRQSEQNKTKLVDLKSVAERTTKLLLGSLAPKSHLELQCCKSSPKVLSDESKITQILVNLIVNAHDALEEAKAKDNSIKITLEVDQDMAKISVSDRGVGMSEEIKKKVFQPYFTTKLEKGTGLGLTTVLAIVRELCGRVEIQSEEGKGCTVSVYLPVSKEEEKAETSDSVVPEFKQDNMNILIVDDEEVIRSVLELNLRQLGFNVTLAETATRGIDIYKEDISKYDLIILDMLMPVISGDEFFYIIREINPKQKFLIISGFCSDDKIDALLAEGDCEFLSKPFTVEELSSKMQICFDQ